MKPAFALPTVPRGIGALFKHRWEIWLLLATPLVGELTLALPSRAFYYEVMGVMGRPVSPSDLSDVVGLLIVRLPFVLVLTTS